MKLVNKILEVDGIPFEWLNKEEQADAKERMKGKELQIMEQLNPSLTSLIEGFGLARQP
jgi:hypothetical protein